MLNIVPPSETSDLPLEITSNVSYELHVSVDSEGSVVPVQMGSGKFAKVFRAMQRSTGRDIQPVAIKVLHDYSDLQAERQERAGEPAGVGAVKALPECFAALPHPARDESDQ